MIVVQHHQDQDVRVAIDVEGLVSTEGGMLQYRTATLPGATGAPCFDIEWRLLGVHLQSSLNEDLNEGIPIAALVEQLHEKNFRWDVTSRITRDPTSVAHNHRSGELDQRVQQFELSTVSADDVWGDDLESIAHSALGEHAEAEALANMAVAAARVSMSSEDIEAALDQLVQTRRQLGDTDGVLRALAELGNLGEALGDDLIQVEANTTALEAAIIPGISSQTFSNTAVRAFSRLPDELIVRAPELARRLVAQVGGDYPALLQRVVRLVGIGPLDVATAADLGNVLQGWAYEDPHIQPYLPKAPASAADVANATQYLVSIREINPDTARSLSNWMRTFVSANTFAETTPSEIQTQGSLI